LKVVRSALNCIRSFIMPPPHRAEALSDDARLTDVCLLHTLWIFMARTATGSKARWAPQV